MCRLGACCKTGCCKTGCCPCCPAYCKCDILQCVCCSAYLPQRWLGTFLTLAVISFSYCMRVCSHLAIVRIVRAPNDTEHHQSECKPRPGDTISSRMTYGTNEWSEQIQALILSSFYIGYLIVHMPVGYLCDRFGARYILTTGFLVSILCTALTPISVQVFGYAGMIALRIIQGCGQGVCYPAATSYLSRWIPPHERGVTGSIAFGGSCVGAILGILISGRLMYLADSWQFIYYFWSGLSLFFYIFLVIFVYSDPDTHPFITEREAAYLDKYLVHRTGCKSVPYCAILTDSAIWATIVCQFGNDFQLYLISNNLPKYLDNVLKYNLRHNALFSSLPYICQLICSLFMGRFADWGIKKKHWDVGGTRKILTTIATFIPGVCMLGVGFMGCRGKFVVALFALAMFFKGPIFAGLKVNTMDLTSRYSGICMALANGFGALAGILVSQLCSALAPNNTLLEWRNVFYVVFGVTVFTNVIYVLLSNGKRRRWDYPPEERVFIVGKPPLISLCDGIDRDRLQVEEGLRAKAEEQQIEQSG